MRWKTICFDLDNTLFSHEDAFEKAICFCFETIFKQKNFKNINIGELFTVFKKYSDLFWEDYENGILTPKDYRRKRFLNTAEHFQLPLTTKEADDFHEHYYHVVDNFSVPYPNLHSFIKNLLDANIKVGIITNGMADTQYNKINKLELNDLLTTDSIFVSEELKMWKPERKIFDYAKSILQSEGEYLFVGDSWSHDVVGAIEAGWDSIFLNTRNDSPITKHKPVKICDNLEEVAAFIYSENNLKG